MLRIYIDTSVIGGCLDQEFKEDSVALFEEFIRGEKILVLSDLVLLELENAPAPIKELLKRVPNEHIEYVALDTESIRLAKAYLKEGIIAEKSLSDARHIALATIARVDILVSWNFKHIVNIHRIHFINSVNLKSGYPLIDIRSPKEILYEK